MPQSPPQFIETEISGDTVEPRREPRCPPEASGRPKYLEEGVLRDVLGLGLIAEHPAEADGHRGLVFRYQVRKRSRVPLL